MPEPVSAVLSTTLVLTPPKCTKRFETLPARLPLAHRLRTRGTSSPPTNVDQGADTWLRIIVTIGTLGEPPTEVRH